MLYLSLYFIHYKVALFSIVDAFGKLFCVDHAIVAKVLIEFDMSQSLLPRISIGDDHCGFGRMLFLSKLLYIVDLVNVLAIILMLVYVNHGL